MVGMAAEKHRDVVVGSVRPVQRLFTQLTLQRASRHLSVSWEGGRERRNEHRKGHEATVVTSQYTAGNAHQHGFVLALVQSTQQIDAV